MGAVFKFIGNSSTSGAEKRRFAVGKRSGQALTQTASGDQTQDLLLGTRTQSLVYDLSVL